MKTKCLIYCTKGKPYLSKDNYGRYYTGLCNEALLLNGKIVAECEVETKEIDTIRLSEYVYEDYYDLSIDKLFKESCLTQKELVDYIGCNWDSKGYSLHIQNLNIFDKPLELSDCYPLPKNFEKIWLEGNWKGYRGVQKAPQNMMWVWYKGERYVLISIRPEWVCKILNGEKKIEVRRKVLKGMIQDD